jgi:hypothetical protein
MPAGPRLSLCCRAALPQLALVVCSSTLGGVPKVQGLLAFLLPLWVFYLDLMQVGRGGHWAGAGAGAGLGCRAAGAVSAL